MGTASRAMGDGGPVSAEARQRVRAAAAKLRFRPSPSARALRGKRPKLLGVVLPAIEPTSAEWLRGASDTASEHGYALVVCDGQGSARVETEQLRRLLEHSIEGLMLAGPPAAPEELQAFLDAGIPISPPVSTPPEATALFERAWNPAIEAACRCLIDEGHRRIACCVHPESEDAEHRGLERLLVRALRRLLGAAGASRDALVVVPVAGAGAVEVALRPLLAGDGAPTAVIAGGPTLTPPLVATITALGLGIPSDVSVLALEESVWEATYRPPLAVVRRDAHAAGRDVTRALIARIERWAAPEPFREAAPVFERRGSIGPVSRHAPAL
jgi:LacI family transcriptional regulator